MKKLSIMFMAVLALAFTACNDDVEKFTSIPQSNAQGPVLSADGLTVEPVVGPAIDLNDMGLGEEVELLKVKELTGVAETATLSFTLQIDTNETFETAQEVILGPAAVGETVTVFSDVFNEFIQSRFGRAPQARTLYIRYAAYVINSSTEMVRLSHYYAQQTLEVTPVAPEIVIEDAYYLVGTINGWSVPGAVAFNHSAASVYDDPVFTLVVEISDAQAADGWWWKILPESTVETGEWQSVDNGSFGVAVDGSTELAGILVGRTVDTDCGAGCIKEAGKFKISINMLELTYEYEKLPDLSYMYTPGESNSWNASAGQALVSTDASYYNGFAYLAGQFKYAETTDWSGADYGDGGAEGVIAEHGGNLTAEAGNYYLEMSTTELYEHRTKIDVVGVIGSFAASGWGSDVVMTEDSTLCYSCTVDFAAGDEFKFRFNSDWGLNLGGDMNDLTYNGSNIVVGEAGTYLVTLNLSAYPYKATIVKQ